MNKNFRIIVLLIFLAQTSMWSQEKWTLSDCIAYALDNNLALNNFKFEEQANRETYRQSVRNLLPIIEGSSRYNVNYGRSTDPNTNDVVTTDFFSNNYNIASSVDLFKGFQKINSIKVAKFLQKAALEETTHQKYLLAFSVNEAFYDIKYFEELVAIAKEQQQVSQTNYDLVKKQIELGLKAGADLYEAEALLLSDKLKVTQSQNSLNNAKLKLIQVMNLEGADDISIQTELSAGLSLESKIENNSDSIFNRARDFVPLIKAQELKTQAAKKEIMVARGRLYPSLSLFGSIGTGYFETTIDSDTGVTIPFKDQFRDNTFQVVGLSLTVPISYAWSARSRVKQQKIAYKQAQNNLDIQKQELRQTIQQLVQEYEALQIEYQQSEKKLETQNLSFAIAQKKYEKGLISALELFAAKNLYASAQNENLQVRLKSEINQSTLDFYKGLPIYNIN